MSIQSQSAMIGLKSANLCLSTFACHLTVSGEAKILGDKHQLLVGSSHPQNLINLFGKISLESWVWLVFVLTLSLS